MFRPHHSAFFIGIIFPLWLFTSQVSAWTTKEFGNQKNIYVSEWARLKHKAELGDPEALFALGNFYFQPPEGSPFRQDYKRAAEFYLQSGVRSNPAAQYNLAIMLHRGMGVKKNLIASFAWFSIASKNKSPVAKNINQQSERAAFTIQSEMTADDLTMANQYLKNLQSIMSSKRYREARLPE